MSVALVAGMMGCRSERADTAPPAKTTAESKAVDATPTDAGGGAAAHGAPIELGNATIGIYSVRASRDSGEIKPGGDAPIDVWLTGDISKVRAVRFWIGTKSGTDAIKARADIENKAEPNHWHTHAEIPDPMPVDCRLWVEIETSDDTHAGAFGLSM
ncbi:MAG: hypothetical protein H6818_22060 [Phycisphaerales bacterium]|nr:hypothetical protein [Phycisphaerales bacterium]MCB9862477.1 hypothetical protein [Phycisphaerales bacterium]